jgi:Zn-dependent protease with chaperone function
MDKNTDCILNFFQNQENIFENYLAFSSTHPTSKERIKQISSYSL